MFNFIKKLFSKKPETVEVPYKAEPMEADAMTVGEATPVKTDKELMIEKVKELRESGLSFNAIAKKVGLSVPTVTKYYRS